MRGVEIIKKALEKMPSLPGVYKMIGERGIIYIGKAKNLKNRIKNYTKLEEQTNKNKVMISSVKNLEYEVVRSEEEALILESSLIKKHKPQFNILLKDDKSSPYIAIQKHHSFPAIFKIRGKPDKSSTFYGPFGDRAAIEEVINVVCKTFKLRSCSDEKFKMAKRPCLEYQIQRCTAPCVSFISEENYKNDLTLASNFLSGKINEVLKTLKEKMQNYAEREEFEMAARFRDKIFSIEKLLKTSIIDFKKLEDVDAVLIEEMGGRMGIEVFSVRSGFSYGASVFFPTKTEDETKEDVMEFFLMRYYEDLKPPEMIVLNVETSNTVKEVLSQKAGKKIKIWQPKKGEYKELIDFALPNLTEKLGKKVNEKANILQKLNELKTLLELKNHIKRIEIYDNSHTAGSFMLGAMVVFGEEGFLKGEYRKFNSKLAETKAGDDYGMLKETLKRRFLNKEIALNKPDLIIIDGGKGQFSAAMQVFEDLNLEIPFICMAKGRDRNAGKEWFYYKDKEFQFSFTDPLLYFLQNLRDEAHRFAITSHRSRRDKNMF